MECQSPPPSPGVQLMGGLTARSEPGTRTAGEGSGPENGTKNGERAGRKIPLFRATECEHRSHHSATKASDELPPETTTLFRKTPVSVLPVMSAHDTAPLLISAVPPAFSANPAYSPVVMGRLSSA